MTPEAILRDVLGGQALFDWFGYVPTFHDAELLDIAFSSKGAGRLRIHVYAITNEVDARGYFVLDKHVVVTMTLEGVSKIDCADFDMMPGIIFDLTITKDDQHYRIEWDASYGVAGTITSKQVRIDLEPGKP